MGTIQHHAIVVVGWQDEGMKAAHAEATKIFPWVSPISPPAVNGYTSFFIPPDGSKEWWDESRDGDARREAFYVSLKEKRNETFYYTVVEVAFGELGLSAQHPLSGTKTAEVRE